MNDLFFVDLELIKNDEQQYKAYNSMINTAVIAGPGSGKTRVLALKAVLSPKAKYTSLVGWLALALAGNL